MKDGMKKAGRLTYICIVIMFGLVLTGCNGRRSSTNESNKSAVYLSARDEMEFIVEAISKKDAAAIKNKFSEYACNNIDDLDGKIERLIVEFPGIKGTYSVKDTFERHSNYGKITNIYTPSYDFNVDNDTYRMRIIYYVEADEEPDKLGWYSIQLYKRHDPDNSSDMYTHGVKDAPDILLWDYTKDR